MTIYDKMYVSLGFFLLFLRRLRNGYNETLVTASMYNGFGFLVDLIGRFEGIFSISGDHLLNISVVIIGPFVI